MEQTITIPEDVPKELFIPEEFSLKGQSVAIVPMNGCLMAKITASAEKQLMKAKASLKSTCDVFLKMREVAHGD